MGTTHAEFMRLLPRALAGFSVQSSGSVVTARSEGKRVRIELGPERSRRIANLVLPVVDVTLELDGFSDAEARDFESRFALTYQRGGG